MSKISNDLETLSAEAFTYLYPLVTMELTRRQQTLSGDAHTMFGPANQFTHLRAFPTADFRAVVRPNFDTLYSSIWLDLTGGPVRIDVPDSDDRYYLLPMLDMWTDVFTAPGKRTTGTGPQSYLVVPPGFSDDSGTSDDGCTLIKAPTNHVWVIGRTQTNGPADYEAVARFQDGFSVTPPEGWKPEPPRSDIDPTIEPLRAVNTMAALDFFALAAEVLEVNQPHATDNSVLARIADLGIVPGQEFDADRFDTAQRTQIEAGAQQALASISDLSTVGKRVNGWNMITESIGVYGNDYLARARVCLGGLGANPPEDAVYPLNIGDADGHPLHGESDYVLHFEADELPPVYAFWSVTMYDTEGFQSANEINRFAIGDRDDLTVNSDGSLDIWLQRGNPGEDKVANWLPAPTGGLGVTLRLYAPKHSVLDGSWSPPPIRVQG